MKSTRNKGIVLAGGYGTRLYPLTESISKQLLPVYDKPMIYYPISVLMLAGIRDILIITSPDQLPLFKKLLHNGNHFGIKISYATQKKPEGLAQAFIIGENFIKDDNVCLILGDNIFYGQGFSEILARLVKFNYGAQIVAYPVKNASSFGVVEIDTKKKPISLEEKPKYPKSNYAITGLYFYNNDVIKIAKKIKPSKRGELEINSINQVYLNNKQLKVEILGRGFAWLDTGSHESLLEASQFIETIEKRQGYKIACLEEIALKKKWIKLKDIKKRSIKLKNTTYGKYLNSLIK